MRRFRENTIPYDETLRRLNSAFRLKPGDLITHEELRAVIQPANDVRYRGVIATWKRKVMRERGIRLSGEGRARGLGLMVCTPLEQSDFHIDHGRRGASKIRRSERGLREEVDATSFTSDQLERHNLAVRYLGEAAHAVNKLRNIPAPKATPAGNVRLFKGE